MADKAAKFILNTPGKYYVDDQCIACDACVVEAPRFFAMEDIQGHAYVKLQPQDRDRVGQEECQRALEICPVRAIGGDGERALK